MSSCLEFRLLGPLEVLAGGQPAVVAGPRQRIVLAMLLLERGRIVPATRLVEAVWGEAPPATARSQVQMCVSTLRRRFGELGSPDLITPRPAGYLLDAGGAQIDVDLFRRLTSEGRAAAQQDDLAEASRLLRAALAMWRGQAVADVDSQLVQTYATGLNEERFTAREECIAWEMALGRQGALIGELSELVAQHPLRTKLWGHLMLALYRAGRQGDALAAYGQAREKLATELGLDPPEDLRALERAILGNDPGLDLPATASRGVPGPGRGRVAVPRQLPSAIPDFVGRDEALQRIRRFLTPGACRPDGSQHVEVVIVGGRSGVGKSALALQVAHDVRTHYPDGQLFAQLRADDARPGQVLERFLRALGVPPALMPSDLEELAAMYRSQLADRRFLVVLDDALTEDQVLPFVPGEPGSALLVTSRRALAGVQGTHRVNIDVLSPINSAELLGEVIGHDRVRAEPLAVAALARACDHLPLALRVAAAKLSARDHWTVGQMVTRLTDEARRLDELTLGDVGVRASLSLSFEGLGCRARRLLLLLGMLGPTDFAHWVAAPLLDVDPSDSDEVLDELVQARLVEVLAGADRGVRFHLHDLVRIFAGEQAPNEISHEEREQAQHRLLRCWLSLASVAQEREFGECSVLHSDVARWALPSGLIDLLVADPLTWFLYEQLNLIAAVECAAAMGHDELCWDLALTTTDFFESLGLVDAWQHTSGIALRAVRNAQNKRGEAAMLYSLAGGELHGDDARRDLLAALDWFTEADEAHGRGLVLIELAGADRYRGEAEHALITLQQSLPHLRVAGDRAAEAYVLTTMAKLWLEFGQYDTAEAALRQALDVCPAAARRVKTQLTYWLGQTFRARGQLSEAESVFHKVRSQVSLLNDPVGKAFVLLGIGRVQTARRDFRSAEETLLTAVDAFDQLDHRYQGWDGKSHAILALVELALAAGDLDTAAVRLDEYEALSGAASDTALRSRVEDVRQRFAGVAKPVGWLASPTTNLGPATAPIAD